MYRPPVVSLVVPPHKVMESACIEIARLVGEALSERGVALVGCSGSGALHPLYARLGLVSSVDWSRVVFFAVDEGFVPGQSALSGATRRAVAGSFASSAQLVFPDVTCGGADACCRGYEAALEGLHALPDVVIVTVEEEGRSRCAGLCAPIVPEAFDGERLAVVSRDADAFVPVTISASLSFLQRSRNVCFVLPTAVQSAAFHRHVVSRQGRVVDRVSEAAAAMFLFGCSGTHVVSC